MFVPTSDLTIWWPVRSELMCLIKLRSAPNGLFVLCLVTTVRVMLAFMLWTLVRLKCMFLPAVANLALDLPILGDSMGTLLRWYVEMQRMTPLAPFAQDARMVVTHLRGQRVPSYVARTIRTVQLVERDPPKVQDVNLRILL